MKCQYLSLLLIISSFTLNLNAQLQTTDVKHFDKVIISPHIEVKFVQSNIEQVVIHESKVALDKINIKNTGKTLRIYLDDAKIVTKMVRDDSENYKMKKGIYRGTNVKATVYYRTLKGLSTRGKEKFVIDSPLVATKFKLKVYGASHININEINLDKLVAKMYGESFLKVKSGIAKKQKFRAYGESVINVSNIRNNNTSIYAFGEGSYQLNVMDKLFVSAFGETIVSYTGTAKLKKGLVLGEAEIHRND